MRWISGALVVLAIGLGAPGCGDTGPTAEEKAKAAAEQRRAVEHRDALARLADAKTAAQEAQAKADQCKGSAGDLVDALSELNSRLNIGLSYAAYSDKVADVQVAYDDVGFSGADADELDCISAVGLPAEKALNSYTAAYRTWNTCFESLSCDNDSITPSLQRRWSRASGQVRKAKSGMALLERRATNAANKVHRLTDLVRRTAPAPTTAKS